MTEKSNFSGTQRGIERHELAGKVGKNAGWKTRNGDNLAKLNDRECPFFAHRLHKNHLENKGSEYVLLVFRP